MRLEDICHPVGVRILRYVLDNGQANITRISRDLGLHHSVVRRHLERFTELGLLEERRYERLHIYTARLRDPRVAALKRLLDELEHVARLMG